MELLLLRSLLVAHIVTGATGAIGVRVLVIGRKGGTSHRRRGRLFKRGIR